MAGPGTALEGEPSFGPRVCRHWATDTAAPTAAASALSSDANSASASFTDVIIAQSVSGDDAAATVTTTRGLDAVAVGEQVVLAAGSGLFRKPLSSSTI
jgi:hypothetical protein